jgi:hypothetical protein
MATLPLLVLGGGDRNPHYLPPRGRDKQPLTGCKGADVRIGARRLIDLVLERFEAVGESLGPTYIAGPAAAYGRVGSAHLIDTDGDFGENLAAGIDVIGRAHPGSPIAVTTCDVLPEEAELRGALEHYHSNAPCDMWFPLVRTPADERALGESAWKPRYRIVSESGEPTPFLPGHLAIFDPGAMRLDFLYRLLQRAYESRNRSVLYRRWYMIRRVSGAIVSHDVDELLHGRLPALAVDVVLAFRAARWLARGVLPVHEVERALRRLFTHRAHRRRYPERRIVLSFVDGLSLARDNDTVEEARALGALTVPAESIPVA